MKIVYVLSLFLLLTSCKNDSNSGQNSSDSTTATPAAEATAKDKPRDFKFNVSTDNLTTSPPPKSKPAGAGRNANQSKGASGGGLAKSGDLSKKPEGRVAQKPTKAKKKVFEGYDPSIPDACTLVSLKTIAAVTGANESAISINDGSSAQVPTSRACFFKWDDQNVRNAGVMVSVQKNPVPNEVPEYIQLLIGSKKTAGEQAFTDEEVYYYKDFPDVGDEGAYSYDLHKYLWRLGNDRAIMVAFNANMSEKEEYAAAVRISKELLKNLNL